MTQTPTVQTNKISATVLPSLTAQQLSQFQNQQQQQQQQIHMQQQNSIQTCNNTPMRVCLRSTSFYSIFHSITVLDTKYG